MKKIVLIRTKEGEFELSEMEWLLFDINYLHCTNKAAVEYLGSTTKFWYQEGKRHRLNGPAVELENGEKAWRIDDFEYSKHLFDALIRRIKEMPLELRLTDPRWWVREFK